MQKRLSIFVFFIKRLLYLIAILFGVSFFTFAVTTSAPGGNVALRVSGDASYFFRYIAWLRLVFLGHTGGIYWPRSGVFFYFGKMIPGTFRLAGVSLIVIILISLPLGIISALKQNSPFDYIVRFFAFFGASIPNFILGFILIFAFVVGQKWFSLFSGGELKSMVLPVSALTIPLISGYLRHIRGVTLEELSQDYVTGAAARGLRQWRIMMFHIFPNLLPSMLSYTVVSIGRLLSSVAIIETIFIYRGVGSLAVSSIRVQDYPVIQSFVMWMALVYIISSFIIDTINFITNPLFHQKGV
jgi:peptide/nickel transport system permease protein